MCDTDDRRARNGVRRITRLLVRRAALLQVEACDCDDRCERQGRVVKAFHQPTSYIKEPG
jgi:hypothetical protein